MDLLYKVQSVQLSPVVPAQISMGILCNPPKQGDASYESFHKERSYIIESLKRRAVYMTETFNSLEGVTCNRPEGSMYVFPQIRLPAASMAEAKALGKSPDLFYALAMLEEVGIYIVPGKSFGQADGTFH